MCKSYVSLTKGGHASLDEIESVMAKLRRLSDSTIVDLGCYLSGTMACAMLPDSIMELRMNGLTENDLITPAVKLIAKSAIEWNNGFAIIDPREVPVRVTA